MRKLGGIFRWLDDNILLVLTGFLFAFIPLYPKIPLAELIPGYIVRLRLEDILIMFAVGVWFIQVLRRKATLKTPLTVMILLYLAVGLLSSLSAIFITKTVPMSLVHVQKLFFNYGRRIEYFSLFFIAFSAVKSRKDIKKLLIIFAVTVFLIGAYGFGQKYLYWPVYSTMNREFSKGLRLYLTAHARVQSTFGGHYDFAAFLVIALPVLLAFMSFVKRRILKVALAATYLVSLWGLMMTSSRSSFLAFIFSVFLLFALQLKRRGALWVGSRLAGVYIVTAVFFFSFGDLSERFAQIFTGAALQGLQSTVSDAKKIASQPFVEPPKDGISIDDVNKAAEEAAKKQKATVPVIVPSDTQPVPVKPSETLPPDVYEDIPDKIVTTTSETGEEIVVVLPRVFSENAHLLGLSAAIRLDTLWPYAIRGFLRNPLLGSGYSTLTKSTIIEFTEAESTDNDFLRTLGETGLLGFITFYGTIVLACVFAVKKARLTRDPLLSTLATVLIAVTAGLLVNAVYIDLFISSKVIETYWIFTGALLAYAVAEEKRGVERLAGSLKHLQKSPAKKPKRKKV